MEEARVEIEEAEQPVYQPRPAWQVWLARVAAGIVILGVILYYWHIASGGRGCGFRESTRATELPASA